MTIEIRPNDGWKKFNLNKEVADFLYSLYDNILNPDGWNYQNFTSDTAIFEDPEGNTIYLEFSELNKEGHRLIEKMIFTYSTGLDIRIIQVLDDLSEKFKLKPVS